MSRATWLRPNIRVRVVHKSYASGRAYLGKGRVVDVPRLGEATVRMDVADLVLEGDYRCKQRVLYIIAMKCTQRHFRLKLLNRAFSKAKT